MRNIFLELDLPDFPAHDDFYPPETAKRKVPVLPATLLDDEIMEADLDSLVRIAKRNRLASARIAISCSNRDLRHFAFKNQPDSL